jgi:hypothetical protein
MLETSHVNSELEKARSYANRIGLRGSLEQRLAALETFAPQEETRCVLSAHPAPYSFSFAVERRTGPDAWARVFRGAVLFHGAHDRYGTRPAPPVRPTAVRTFGWMIHR